MSFACTYAGQPVCLDHDGRLADLLETRWPDPGRLFSRDRMGGAASPFLAGGINDRIKPPYPDLPRIGLNEVIVPTGASRFARGLFVVDNVRLKEIVYDAYGHTDASSPALSTLPAEWDDAWTPQTLAITQGGVTFSRSMYLLPPVVLDASGDNTLWLLPLVDARYFWQAKGFEDADNASGWSALITALAGAAGTTLSGSVSPNAAYGTFDPETFTDKSVSVGAAIDAAALSIGHRAVYSGGAAVAFQSAADADSLRATNLALDGLRLGGTSPGMINAESPRVTCRLVNDHWPAPTGFYDVVPSVNNTGTSPDRPSIRSSWYVEHFGGTVAPAASTAVQAFADQLATDLLAWGNRPYVASFAGIANWTLSGHDDYLAIRIHDDIGGAAAIMRVASLPMSFRPAVNLCQRPDIYVHPHSTATGTLYEALAASGSAEMVFDAVGSLYGGTPANVGVTLSASNPTASLASGTRVFLHYQAGQGWAVVATSDSSEESLLIGFTLTDSLSSGTASATVDGVYPTDADNPPSGQPDVDATVSVTDPQSLFKYGVAGSKGWAWKSGDTYRVIQCDQLALQLMGTLVEQVGSPSNYGLKPTTFAKVSATVESLTPAPFSQLPQDIDAEEIPNPLKLFGNAGDSVVLQFDQATGKYFVLAVQRIATRVIGDVVSNFSETAFSFQINSIQGLDGESPPDASIEVQNVHQWDGTAGQKVRAEKNWTNGEWQAYQKDC